MLRHLLRKKERLLQMKHELTYHNVEALAVALHITIQKLLAPKKVAHLYPIPRGGVPVAMQLKALAPKNYLLVQRPEDADFFVDDIIDSGETMQRWCDAHPGKPFMALVDKTVVGGPFSDGWVVFPWEGADDGRSGDDTIVGTLTNRLKQVGAAFHANDNIAAVIKEGDLASLQAELTKRADHFLRGLVIDVDNDHNTVGTARRMAKMYLKEVFKGRYQPAPEITDFPNAKGLDEMYLTGPITVRSACSHHFVPIVGRCWIGVVPGDRVIGLSKFNRIVEWVASRPQIQEELVMQIADYIEKQIEPRGLAVVVEATHMCMTWRGVREPMEARMTTNVMRGVFREEAAARAEFMALVAKCS